MNWAAQEFETVELGDKRLNNRLVNLVEHWHAEPVFDKTKVLSNR